MKKAALSWLCLALFVMNASAKEQPYDVIIAGGTIVGATSIRVHVIGCDDRRATPVELQQMQSVVRQAMEEGALHTGAKPGRYVRGAGWCGDAPKRSAVSP